MALRSTQIAGAAVYTSTHLKRIVDAVGENVFKYLNEFVNIPVDDTTGLPTEWTVTTVDGGTDGAEVIGSGDVAGGALLITTNDAENDGSNIQLNGEAFSLAAGNVLYYGTKFKINDVTQSDFFAGLAVTDTDILGGVTDRIGFQTLDGSTDLTFMLEKDSTETLSSAIHTLVDDTEVFAEFYLDAAGNVEVFIDGVSVLSPAVTNLPNDEELRASYHLLTGEAAAQTATITKLNVVQIGAAVA